MNEEVDLTMKFIDEQLQKSVFRSCPNCKIVFDLASGCNFVTCSECNTPFCWKCGLKKGSSPNECPYGNPDHNSH